jgi:hypothetical protein
MRLFLMGLILGLLGVRTASAEESVIAAAPLAFSDADLGRPYTSGFEPLIEKEGRPLFPSAKVRRITESTWSHDFVWFESTVALRANARAWFVNGSVGTSSRKRYAVWRAIQVTHALEIDDTSERRTVAGDAAYYVRKVYFGRIYEVVISGTEDVFTAGIRAELVAYGGGVEALRKKYGLEVKVTGRGLKPKAEAVFAQNTEELRMHYVKDETYNAGKPTPILVEYRRIPGGTTDEGQEIEWHEAVAPIASRTTRVRGVQVLGSNSDWTDTGLVASGTDLVVGFAEGSVTYGWGANSGPETSGTGGLDMRIGPDTFPTGKSWAIPGKTGPIKLRVRDNKHSDNRGAFTVMVVVVPKEAMEPVDCKLLDAAGETQPCPK